MDEPEWSYFPTDRVVGVFEPLVDDDGATLHFMTNLIHLTSRFGAFTRKGQKWEPIWHSLIVNPSSKYINFEEDSYRRIQSLFDGVDEAPLEYAEICDLQEVQEWEGEFDEVEGPKYLRDVAELVNWVQDFVEPRPAIFSYGSSYRMSCSDMAWIHPYLEELEELRRDSEEYVLAQRRKSAEVLVNEQLREIEMYPPLNDLAMEIYNEAGSHASLWNYLDEFDEETRSTPYMKYFKGGTASIKQLNSYYLENLSKVLDLQQPLTQTMVDSFVVTREKELMPADRIEIWFADYGLGRFVYLVANTEIGLFTRGSKGSWRVLNRDPEVEDLVDLSGAIVVHIRPERVKEVLQLRDKGTLENWNPKTPELNKFQVHYRGLRHSPADLRDRRDLNPGEAISYASLSGIASNVIREMVFEFAANLKVLEKAGLAPDDYRVVLNMLKSFLDNEMELSRYEIHRFLNRAFSVNEDGEGWETLVLDARKAIETQERFEKLIDKRYVDYLVRGSMILLVSFYPDVTMWLEYRSPIYGKFSRRKGEWQKGLTQDNERYQYIHVYEVKEECVEEMLTLLDGSARGGTTLRFEEIAPLLCIYGIPKDADIDAEDPLSWDLNPFKRDQLPPSMEAVFKYYFVEAMTYISNYSEGLDEDDEEGAMLVDEYLTGLHDEQSLEFYNGESTLNRHLLRKFLDMADGILSKKRLTDRPKHQ